MGAPISPWSQVSIRDREREAAKLKARFATVSRRSFRRWPPRLIRRIDGPLALLVAGLIAAAALVLYRWTWHSNLWLANQAALSAASIRSCEDARRLGIAPLYAGYPGYREGLDRDRDGIACEPHPF